MERSKALKRLEKTLGKRLAYRVDTKAATPEEREAARAELSGAIKERERINEAREARARVLLAADAEYQALTAELKAARERTEELGAVSRSYKFTVGTIGSGFFSVAAEGDTWEQVIAKVEGAR